MKPGLSLAVAGTVALQAPTWAAQAQDARLRDVVYDPAAVLTVPVKRGSVTLVMLDADEAIAEVASGLGSDCTRPEASWCVAAQAGGRTLFVKPKSTASAVNNLVVVTDKRVHSFRFEVLADDARREPVYRLVVHAPVQTPAHTAPHQDHLPKLPALPTAAPAASPDQIVVERLRSKPRLLNTRYSLADGPQSLDIVPSLVFDDGRFTYLRFGGNREIPAVFQVLADGSEALVNVRMEDDLLVVDRVSRRLMLRSGSAVVALWNDAFDGVGIPPEDGTTVPGVRRVARPSGTAPAGVQEKAP